jgi:hypothetical protein
VSTTLSGTWTSPALDRGGDAVAAWAAEQLAELGEGADALCVASLDAGALESVAFWRDGLTTGLAFANPRAFPWTLANSPAGRVAERLGVRGPTFTLVGRAEALTAALEHARDELAAGRARRVLVAALDGLPSARVRLAGLVLTPDGPYVDRVPSPNGAAPIARPTASETLAELVRQLECGEPVAVGSEREGLVEVRPRRAEAGPQLGSTGES